jgi:hypothetical protein
LTLYHPGRGAASNNADGGVFINAIDAKDRVKEYHSQVNEKRRLIHQKKMDKRRKEEEENPTLAEERRRAAIESKDAKLGSPKKTGGAKAPKEAASPAKQ